MARRGVTPNVPDDWRPGFVSRELVMAYRDGSKNPISAMMEYGQSAHCRVDFIDGPQDTLNFRTTCFVDEKRFSEGNGKTKKEAKYRAASDAFAFIAHAAEKRWGEEDDYSDDGASGGSEFEYDLGPTRREFAEEMQRFCSETPEAMAHYDKRNAVTKIFEYYQKTLKEMKLINSDHPVDANRGFRAQVFIDNELKVEAYGHSKRLARMAAAERAIKELIPKPPEFTDCPSGRHIVLVHEETCQRCQQEDMRNQRQKAKMFSPTRSWSLNSDCSEDTSQSTETEPPATPNIRSRPVTPSSLPERPITLTGRSRPVTPSSPPERPITLTARSRPVTPSSPSERPNTPKVRSRPVTPSSPPERPITLTGRSRPVTPISPLSPYTSLDQLDMAPNSGWHSVESDSPNMDSTDSEIDDRIERCLDDLRTMGIGERRTSTSSVTSSTTSCSQGSLGTPRSSVAARIGTARNVISSPVPLGSQSSIDRDTRASDAYRAYLSSTTSVAQNVQPIRHRGIHLTRSHCQSSIVVIQVLRVKVLQDLIKEFIAPDILNAPLKMRFKNEEAEDEDGVSREVYTAFWESFLQENTDGNTERVPVVRQQYGPEEWGAVGRILLKGYKDHNVFPLQLSKAFVVGLIFGEEAVKADILLDSYEHYLSPNEWEILDRAQNGILQHDEQEELLDILVEIGSNHIPKDPSKMREALLQLAHLKLIQEPKYAMDSMADTAQIGLRSLFNSVLVVKAMFDTKKPTVKKVVDSLKYETENQFQEKSVIYLKKYIRCLEPKSLGKFLRFVTGTDTICGHCIQVEFTSLTGLERRPIARTCGPVLELPITYKTFLELRNDFDNILNSNILFMDII